jgi:hypothetical protein
VSDILLRAEFHEPVAAHRTLAEYVWPWVKEQTAQGRELVAVFRLLEDAITEAQRGYLHAGVLTQIAEEAVVNGQRFPMKVWKEWYRSEFLGFEVVTGINPFTGRKTRRRVRVSTEDLGVRGMAMYIDRVIAHASTEQRDKNGDALTIRPPLTREVRESLKRYAKREWIDPETGEITETAACEN